MTVISAWHNRADAVDLSVASLAAQDYPACRIILVDDESRDDTFAALNRWASDRIEVRRQKNRGFTQTMIDLCAGAESEYIAVHGAGDESLPQRLSAQVAFLRAHPNVVAVGCGIENVDIVSGRRWDVPPRHTIRPGPIAGDFAITHGEVMFRRDAYLRAGGYRTAFAVGQASDLFRRMSRLGDFGYVPDILYRRYLRLDGVNAKIAKVAERSVLAAISGAVHRRAVAAGATTGDDLDRYGQLLAYMAPHDKAVARSLAQASTLYWAAGDGAMARRLARRSLAEAWTLRGWLARAGTLVGVGPLRAPMETIARRLSRGEGEFARERLTGAG
ncbi:MAG: glycosyltransferase family A protein [Sphingomonas fennica]